MGTGCTGVIGTGGGTAPGLLNCASSAARFAVGFAAAGEAVAAGAGTGVAMGGGKPAKGGGWKGAGAGMDDDCAGDETRFKRSARLSIGGCGVGAGCGVDCTGGLKPASSWAIFGGALDGGAPTGGNPGDMPCGGKPCTGVGGANVGIGVGVGRKDCTCLRTASSCCGGRV